MARIPPHIQQMLLDERFNPPYKPKNLIPQPVEVKFVVPEEEVLDRKLVKRAEKLKNSPSLDSAKKAIREVQALRESGRSKDYITQFVEHLKVRY